MSHGRRHDLSRTDVPGTCRAPERSRLLEVRRGGTDPEALLHLRTWFDITTVHSIDAALATVSRQRPEAVILTLPLLGVDAAALCRALRRRGPAAIIVLSNGDDREWIAPLEAGADAWIAVPCDTPSLRTRIESVIQRYPGDRCQTRDTAVRIGPVSRTVMRHDHSRPGMPSVRTAPPHWRE
ncbi:MAG: response regulator transcription factor [Ilumatobacteraceae bacterium]